MRPPQCEVDQSPEPGPLAVFRYAQGLTQRDLAHQAGVSRDTISRLERGETPTLRTAYAIAAVLGAELLELFPFNDNDAPRQTRRGHNLQPIGAAGHGTT